MSTPDVREPMAELLLRSAVEEFLYREARYMDEFRHEEWLSLWDEDADADILYWVPCGDDDYDPTRQVSLIYDNRGRLRERIFRLQSPAAHSQDPPSRMRRLVSNVEAHPQTDESRLSVYSNFLLGEFRNDEQTVYCGRVIHELRRAGDDFRIISKKVLLINNSGVIGNLTFFL